MLRALLIGSWFNAMFYMLELSQVRLMTPPTFAIAYDDIQAYTYFSVFRRDPALIKYTVIFNLVVDTLGTANNCACIYLVSTL